MEALIKKIMVKCSKVAKQRYRCHGHSDPFLLHPRLVSVTAFCNLNKKNVTEKRSFTLSNLVFKYNNNNKILPI